MGGAKLLFAVLGVSAAALGCQKCEKATIHLDNRTGVTCQVYLDGTFLVTLGPAGTHAQQVKDGNHTVTADCSALALSEDLDCGVDWFISID